MPITPFNIVAGVIVKSSKPKHFSWTVFALANVLIDTEAVYYFLITGIPQHKYFHTWIGATIILILCALLGKYLCQWWLQIWNKIFLNTRYFPHLKTFKSKTKIDPISAWIGATVGAYTHIILDSFVNLDMKPYFPFSDKNHLLGLISLQNIYYLCIGLFIVGVLLYFQNIKKR